MNIKQTVIGGLAALALGGCAPSSIKIAVRDLSSYNLAVTSLIPSEATLISAENYSAAPPKYKIDRYDTNEDKRIDAVEITVYGEYSYSYMTRNPIRFLMITRCWITETADFEKYLLLDTDYDEYADLMYIDKKSTWRGKPRGHNWPDGIYEKVVDLNVLIEELPREMREDKPIHYQSFSIEPVKMDKLKLLYLPL